MDPTGTYRYFLSREWASDHGRACFVMLNPSTADADKDDPTIRSCIRIAQHLGLGTLHVVNLFAFRATDQKELMLARDPIGPKNDAAILTALIGCGYVIAAWGVERLHYRPRAAAVKRMMAQMGVTLWCLGRNQDGSPKHPLFMKGDTALQPFVLAEPKQ
jgi:hypothetical protein